MNKHTRFYIDLTKEENDRLNNLAISFTKELGIKVSKGNAMKLSFKIEAMKRGL
jgi:hypothetical protein